MGGLYDAGMGCTQDAIEAAHWFRRAAERGDPGAQGKYGWCLLRGEGVAVDAVEGVKWLRAAADGGNLEAQVRRELSLHRVVRASDMRMAQVRLGRCLHRGEGVKLDPVEAYACYAEAGAKGDVKGQFFAGVACEYGWGTRKDKEAAMAWFRMGVAQVCIWQCICRVVRS